MFCSKCGKPIEDDVQYCPFCGSKVNVEWEEMQEISYKKKNDYKRSNGIFSKLMVIVGVFALGIIIITGGFLFLNYKTNNKGDTVNLYEVVEGEGMSRYEWIKLLCENFHVNQFEKTIPIFRMLIELQSIIRIFKLQLREEFWTVANFLTEKQQLLESMRQ